MKIETQPLEDHQVKLTVEVEPQQLEDAKHRAAREVAKRIKIPGFRPGKAPYAVILRQVGEASLMEDALDILVNDIYPKVIDEAGIEPYGPGKLENVVSMEPPVLEFVVPLEADVELGEYQAIEKEYQLPEVTEEQVDKVLADLQERQAIVEPVDRPAGLGDVVTVKLTARRKEPAEGEQETLIRERSFPIVIQREGEDQTPQAGDGEEDEDMPEEWPFPGFSQELVGLSAGQEKTIEHVFAEDSEWESLRGVAAIFDLTVENVKSRVLPEIDDEFATTLGDYENLAALREEVRKGLEQQAKEAYEETYNEELLDQVIEQSTIKYPPQMLEREIDSLVHNLEHRLEDQKLDMDLYLKSRDMTMDDLRLEAREAAEKRLKRSLVLFKVAEAEKIEVPPEDLQNETIRTMDNLSRSMSQKDQKILGDRQVMNNLVGNIMADMITERSMQRLQDIASGRGVPETAQEETSAAEETTAMELSTTADADEPTGSSPEAATATDTTPSAAPGEALAGESSEQDV